MQRGTIVTEYPIRVDFCFSRGRRPHRGKKIASNFKYLTQYWVTKTNFLLKGRIFFWDVGEDWLRSLQMIQIRALGGMRWSIIKIIIHLLGRNIFLMFLEMRVVANTRLYDTVCARNGRYYWLRTILSGWKMSNSN